MGGFVSRHTNVSLSGVRQGLRTNALGTYSSCQQLAMHQAFPFLNGLEDIFPWHFMMPCIGHFGAVQIYDSIHAKPEANAMQHLRNPCRCWADNACQTMHPKGQPADQHKQLRHQSDNV